MLASLQLFLLSQLPALSHRAVYQTAYQDELQVLGCELVQVWGGGEVRRESLTILFALFKLENKLYSCIYTYN